MRSPSLPKTKPPAAAPKRKAHWNQAYHWVAMAFQAAFFGCLAKMAKADGQVSQAEINTVEQIMARLGYTGPMRAAAVEIFRKAKDDAHSAADYLNQLAVIIQFNPQIAMTFLAALHAVAQADGFIHPNEREILLQAERVIE